MKQSELLAPPPEGHLRLADEDSLYGSLACPANPAEFVQRSLVTGIRKQRLDDPRCSGIGWVWQLQRDGVNFLQLVDDHFDDSTLSWMSLIQPRRLARMKNQFPEQRRYIHDAALAGKSPTKGGEKIERPQRNRPRHCHAMWRVRRNPDCAQRRHNPNPLLRANSHYACRCEDQLVLRMVMLGDDAPVLEVVGDARHLRSDAAATIEKDAVALFRHILSQ